MQGKILCWVFSARSDRLDPPSVNHLPDMLLTTRLFVVPWLNYARPLRKKMNEWFRESER